MEIPRLQRLKNLFRQTKDSIQASSPAAQHARQPESQPAIAISPRADAATPATEPPQPPTRVEPQPVSSEQIQHQPPQLPIQQCVVTFYGLSDTGLKRSNNEDHFIVADLTRCEIFVEDNVLAPGVTHQLIGPHGALLAVADGVGGHEDGEIASHIVVEAIAHTLFELQQQELSTAERLTLATQEAHQAIRRYTSVVSGSHSMSSTLTAVHLFNNAVTIAQVGDSRAYLFADGRLTLLTEDQTIVHKMLQNGMLTEEEAQVHPDRHAILQAMGQERAISPVITRALLQPDDCLLICSDGLSSYVEHQYIESILNEDADEQTQCQKLLEAAYAAGGDDNVTILLARLRPVLSS
jgi:serine/threonine protein phosphatase PrpC